MSTRTNVGLLGRSILKVLAVGAVVFLFASCEDTTASPMLNQPALRVGINNTVTTPVNEANTTNSAEPVVDMGTPPVSPTSEVVVVDMGTPPVPPTEFEVATGLPPVPPTEFEVATGLPPVPPTEFEVATGLPPVPSGPVIVEENISPEAPSGVSNLEPVPMPVTPTTAP